MSLGHFASLFLTLHLIEDTSRRYQTLAAIAYPSFMMVDSLCHPDMKSNKPNRKVNFQETVEIIPASLHTTPSPPSQPPSNGHQRKHSSHFIKFIRRCIKRHLMALDESTNRPREDALFRSRSRRGHHLRGLRTRHSSPPPRQNTLPSTTSPHPAPSSIPDARTVGSPANSERTLTSPPLPLPSLPSLTSYSPSSSSLSRSPSSKLRKRPIRTWSSIERIARNPRVMELNRIAMREVASDASRAVQLEQGMVGLHRPYDNSAWDDEDGSLSSWFHRMESKFFTHFQPYGKVEQETWLLQPDSTPSDLLAPEIVVEYWEEPATPPPPTTVPQARLRGKRRSVCSWFQPT